MGNVRFLVLFVLPLLGAVLIFVLGPQIEIGLQAAGAEKAFALLLLAPILQLLGGIVVIVVRGELSDDDEKWAREIAPFLTSGNSTDETFTDLGRRKDRKVRELLKDLQIFLNRFEDMLGFAILSIGFAVDIVALFWQGPLDVRFSAVAIALVGLLAWVVRGYFLDTYLDSFAKPKVIEMNTPKEIQLANA